MCNWCNGIYLDLDLTKLPCSGKDGNRFGHEVADVILNNEDESSVDITFTVTVKGCS